MHIHTLLIGTIAESLALMLLGYKVAATESYSSDLINSCHLHMISRIYVSPFFLYFYFFHFLVL